MLSVVTAWIMIIASTIAICHRLESWTDEDSAREFHSNIAKPILEDPLRWFHSVSGAFLQLFDRVYRSTSSSLHNTFWYAILFCYPAFLLARFILYLFQIPKPTTELMLVTSLVVIAVLAGIRELFFRVMRITEKISEVSYKTMLLKRYSDIFKILAIGMGVMYLTVSSVALIIYGLGFSLNTLTALSLGASLTFPVGLAVSIFPNNRLVISPIRASVSSLFFYAYHFIVFSKYYFYIF